MAIRGKPVMSVCALEGFCRLLASSQDFWMMEKLQQSLESLNWYVAQLAWLLHAFTLNFPAPAFKANIVEKFKMKQRKKNSKHHHTALVLTTILK